MGRRVSPAFVTLPCVERSARRAAAAIHIAALALLSACGEPSALGATSTTGGSAATGGSVAAGGAPSTSGGAPTAGAPPSVTWHQNIAPIVLAKCGGCHRDGGIAPMALDSYAAAAPFAYTMAGAVESGLMPPWGAKETAECSPRLPWKDDPRPSAEQTAMLYTWAELGAPEGDPATAAALPLPPELELRDRNVRLTIPTSVEISGGSDKFLCFSLDPALAQDVWVNGVQVNPGSAQVVHHVLLFADPNGDSVALAGEQGYYDCFGGPLVSNPRLIGAWAPGVGPALTPEGVGLGLKMGARIVANVHYHPHTGQTHTDSSTSVDLRWSTTAPAYEGRLVLAGNLDSADAEVAGGVGFGLMAGSGDPPEGPDFVIPAGASGHVEHMRIRAPGPQTDLIGLRLFTVATHMHYVGVDMKISIERPNGDNECLIQTPDWDFNWQRGYQYDAPIDQVPKVHPGDILDLRCTYDNRMENPEVRDAVWERSMTAPVEVRLGEQTLDEMCLGVFGVAIESELAGVLDELP